MANDMESLAQTLLGAQGKDAAGTVRRLAAALNTPQGQQLLALLSSGSVQTVRRAAQAAASGDQTAARAELARLVSTPEGAAAVRLLAQMLQGGR